MAGCSHDLAVLKTLASIKRKGHISLETLRRLEHIKQGLGQIAVTDEEEASAPTFLTQIKDVEVYVEEGGPTMFECRVEPKHDLNLSVCWYRDGQEVVPEGRIKISHDYGYASLQIFYTYPEDEGTYSCRATNELGEDITEAKLICRPLPHIRFDTPGIQAEDCEVELELVKEAAQRFGVRAKLKGDEIYRESERRAPKFHLKMDNFPKLLAGQSVSLLTFISPVGDPTMKIEWLLNEEPLLFKSSYSPAYDHGVLSLSISKVYPDDFGKLTVRARNSSGETEISSWIGEMPGGEELVEEEEPDLPAWCNKVEKGRLAVECPPEVTKHLVDLEVGETETVKLEVNFIGNPRPEVLWTREGEELVNSRHVQIREREGKTTLVLINIPATMAGEYRMVAISPLGSDLTVSRISILPLDQQSLARIARMDEEGLRQLVQYEERKIVEKKNVKKEKEARQKETREKAKMNS